MPANIKKWFFTVVFLTFLFAPSYSYEPYSEGGLKSPEWQPREMNSRMGGRIEAELKPDSWLCGFFTECRFDLYYFFNRFYNGPAPGRKVNDDEKPWILFIAGGPGEIVDRIDGDLKFLDNRANVVYFDVRGTGFSLIPESNDYDQFLRADYVVEDIETLRKTLTNGCSQWDLSKLDCKGGIKRWDAIYAHSWGTIVAQKYAARYPKMVEKLILSAPVSRGHHDTEQARRKMIVANLFDIFDKHRTKTCSWDSNDSVTFKEVPFMTRVPAVENFCFLKDKRGEENDEPQWNDQATFIEDRFSDLLNGIEKHYGSVNLVISFYDQFKADSKFWGQYRYYRQEFFDAIRELEDFGAGEQHGLQLNHFSRSRKVETAMFLAYYLSLPESVLTNERDRSHPGQDTDDFFRCNENAPFFNGLPVFEKGNNLKRNYCNRIQTAWRYLRDKRNTPSFNQSARARAVFSVYDGLARWIFEIMKNERRIDHEGCFTGKDIQDVSRGDAQLQAVVLNSMVIKEQARKLGTKAGDRICPWDPARVDETGKCKDCLRGEKKVNTLILKGGADAIIAGKQAEYVFEKVLEPGHRALIEFPGVGHVMDHQLKKISIKPNDLDKAVSDFKKIVDSSQANNPAVYQTLIREVEKLQDAAKDLTQPVMENRWDLILAFVNSAEIGDFVQNKKARDAITNLGGCLRSDEKEEFSKGTEHNKTFSECICKLTKGDPDNKEFSKSTEDKEEFAKCICELTKGKDPDCKTLTKKW